MPIVNFNEMLKHAYQNNYAIASFKIINLDFLKGVIQAAEQTDSPIILSICESDFIYSDLEILMPSIEAAARKTLVPVAIQFTNCSSLDTAIKSINLGCNSIKLDTSLSLPSNLSISQDVVNMAHSCGVPVEGFFPEAEKNHVTENSDNTLEEISDYVTNLKIDILDVSIKSSLINTEENPKIDFSRLNQIKETLDIPLAIQGIVDFPDEQYQKLISSGVATIFCNLTSLDIMEKQVRDNTQRSISHSDCISTFVAIETERYIHSLKSTNRALDVLTSCHQWTPVEHLIIYNVEGLSKDETLSMIAEGKRVLSTIPGVRGVFTGEAVQENAAYLYTWLVRFCHPLVIDSYREHPIHKDFADKLFRPVAGKRISIDYQELL